MKHKKNQNNLFANWRAMTLCLFLAVLVYLAFAYGMPAERRVSMPLNVLLPENLKVTSLIPTSADIVVTGNEKQIYMLDLSRIKLYADFSEIQNVGVASVAVTIDYTDLVDYINMMDLTIEADPSIIKLFFEKI